MAVIDEAAIIIQMDQIGIENQSEQLGHWLNDKTRLLVWLTQACRQLVLE